MHVNMCPECAHTCDTHDMHVALNLWVTSTMCRKLTSYRYHRVTCVILNIKNLRFHGCLQSLENVYPDNIIYPKFNLKMLFWKPRYSKCNVQLHYHCVAVIISTS